jgi:hypothetical protein
MPAYFVTFYLVLLILSGLIGIFVIVLMGLKQRRRKGGILILARKPLMRECLHLIIGLIILGLFSSGVLGPWIALISASILLILIEFVMAAIVKLRLARGGPHTSILDERAREIEQKKRWDQIRAKGKAHFLLVRTIAYGLSVTPPFIILGVTSPDHLSIYMQGLIVMFIAFALGGYTSAIRQWNWNKQRFDPKKD